MHKNTQMYIHITVYTIQTKAYVTENNVYKYGVLLSRLEMGDHKKEKKSMIVCMAETKLSKAI